jgi:hypothetical protein
MAVDLLPTLHPDGGVGGDQMPKLRMLTTSSREVDAPWPRSPKADWAFPIQTNPYQEAPSAAMEVVEEDSKESTDPETNININECVFNKSV